MKVLIVILLLVGNFIFVRYSHAEGVYDFKVQMEVEMTHAGKLVVPSVMRYNGNWKIIFKKRERGVFTATLYDFK